MASTFSPILRIELIGTGDQSGTWGSTTNVNLGTLIEQSIAGTATIDVTSANVTLTNFNGATDQARCMALRVTGTPGVSRNIVAPAVSKIYVLANGSNNSVVLKTSTSTGLTVPTGEVYLAYYDTTSLDFRLVGRASSSSNTANTLVLRDASGNFAAGTITATAFSGALNGSVGATTPSTGAFTSLSSTGNTTLGDAAGDTLTVNATPTFNVAVPATSGGTGQSTYAVGDILVGGATNTLVKLADVATGNALISGGVGAAPTYGKIGLTTHVSGTLPAANGGTGQSSYAVGDIVYASTTTALSKLADVATGNALISGGVGVAPSYGKIGLTTHVSGTLPVANGGTGVTTSTGTGSAVLSASPALTGTPTAPTAAGGTNTTQLATTAYVQTAGYNSQGVKTISTSAPTGGSNGDIWYRY